MSRLLHLNGPPGIGKSTLARRWGDAHPGTLVCEIDALWPLVSGWQDDLLETGSRIRTSALAMITAYLREGGDVVVPQLAAPGQADRFAGAASDAGARYVQVLMTAPHDEVVRRFLGRGDDHAWQEHAARMVDAGGGDESLREWTARLEPLDAARLPSTDPDATYDALVALVGDN